MKINNKATKLLIAGFISINASAIIANDSGVPAVKAYEQSVSTLQNRVNTKGVIVEQTDALKQDREAVQAEREATRTKIYKNLLGKNIKGAENLGEILKARIQSGRVDDQLNNIIVNIDTLISLNVAAGQLVDASIQEAYISSIKLGYETTAAIMALQNKALTVVAQSLNSQAASENPSEYANSDAKKSVDALLLRLQVAVDELKVVEARAEGSGLPNAKGSEAGKAALAQTEQLAAAAGNVSGRVTKQHGQIATLNQTVTALNTNIAGLNAQIVTLAKDVEVAQTAVNTQSARAVLAESAVSALKNQVAATGEVIATLTRERDMAQSEVERITADAQQLAKLHGKNWVRATPLVVERYLPAEAAPKAALKPTDIKFEAPKPGNKQ